MAPQKHKYSQRGRFADLAQFIKWPTLLFLIACLCSCASGPNSGPIPQSKDSTLLVYSLLDARPDKKILTNNDPATVVNADKFAEIFRWNVHYASKEGIQANVSCQDLLNPTPEKLKALPTKGENHVLLICLSKWEFANAYTTFDYDLAAYLVNTDTSSMVWTNHVKQGKFLGLLGGPADRLLGQPHNFSFGDALMEVLHGFPKP